MLQQVSLWGTEPSLLYSPRPVAVVPDKPLIPLRPYQLEAVEAVFSRKAAGVKRQILVMAVGSGKTLTFSEVIRRHLPGRALILAHRDELIQQAKEKFQMVAGRDIDVGIVKAESNQIHARVVVASVQTLSQPRRLEQMRRDFDVVVADECFPAGTPIDGRPIEDIAVGDLVRSFNHETGEIEYRPVIRLFRREAKALVRIQFVDGTGLVCTPEHPIYATDLATGKSAYIPAIDLSARHVVHTSGREAHADTEDLRGLWDGVSPEKLEQTYGSDLLGVVQTGPSGRATQEDQYDVLELRDSGCCPGAQPANCVQPEQAGVLLGGMQAGGYQSHFFGDDVANESEDRQGLIGAHDAEQPHVHARGPRAREANIAGNGTQTQGSGRERAGNRGADHARGCLGVATGGGRAHEDGTRQRLPDVLQDRCRQSGLDDRGRGRWGESFGLGSPGAGPEERTLLAVSRVDHFAVQEPGGAGRFGRLCPDGYVYNIEVERNHNYFADGCLVHNCHHAVSPSWRRVIDYFECGTEHGPLLLGVTATPNRSDKIGLGSLFDEIVYEKKLLDMIAEGYLCDVEAMQIPMPVNLDSVKVTAGDWESEALGKAMSEADAHHHIASTLKEFASDRRILAFAPTVALAYELADAINEQGIVATGIDGTTHPEQRKDIYRKFTQGDIQAVVNVGIWTEGTDIPAVDCVAIARPTKSASLYTQIVGRGLRLYPGKKNALVIDYVGATTKHKLQTLSSLIGLPVKETPEEKRASLASGSGSGKSVLSMLKSWNGIITDADGTRRAVEVDLFENSWARWLPADQGMWALPAGDSGMMAIRPNPMGLFDLWEMPKAGKPRKIAADLDLGYAQGMAEDAVREKAEMLAQRDAAWRNDPISPGQEWKLRQLGKDPTLYKTKGEASDAITVAEALSRMAML